jgi:hypothetical protein
MSFDKIAGTYVYCMDYHSGQWSREYRIMCKLENQYQLKLSDSCILAIQGKRKSECFDGAREVYVRLEKSMSSSIQIR